MKLCSSSMLDSMKRRILLIIVVVLLLAFGVWALFARKESEGDKVKVTASFYPMAEFTRQIGGQYVEVQTLVGPGVEPHDFDPRPQDLTGLYRSKLFVYNGAGLEHWADRIQGDVSKRGIEVVRTSDGIKTLPTEDQSEGPTDPHIWLDPIRASQQVDAILAGLKKTDPAHTSYFEQRASAYKAALSALDQAYQAGLATCTSREIITSHTAFRYVADRYRLHLTSLTGLSPDEEPSPQKLADVATFVREHNIKYIFFETLVSPKLAQTISRETGAKTLVFNPIEGLTKEEMQQGKDYMSIQKENLQNLRLALDCK